MIYAEILLIIIGIAAIAIAVFLADGKKTKAVGYVLGSMVILFGVLRLYDSLSAPAAGSIAWYVDHKDDRDSVTVRCMLAPSYVDRKQMGCDQAEAADQQVRRQASADELKALGPR